MTIEEKIIRTLIELADNSEEGMRLEAVRILLAYGGDGVINLRGEIPTA
jgi:hypothetical protein